MGIRVKIRRFGNRKIQQVLRLKPRTIQHAVAPEMARLTLKLVKRQFSEQADPYGSKWKRKERPDGRKVLTGETKRLQNDINTTIRPTGFTVKAAAPYASFHQSGTRRMTARPIFPDRGFLPTKWDAGYSRIIKREIRKLVK